MSTPPISAPAAWPAPTFSGAFEHAWPRFLAHFWPLTGCALLALAIQIPAYVLSFAASALPRDSTLAALLLNFMVQGYSIFIGLPAQYGLYRVGARVAQGHAPDAFDVLWGYRSVRGYLSVLGSTFVLGVVMLAASAPAIAILLIGGCGAVVAAAKGGSPEAATAAILAVGAGVFLLALGAILPAVWLALRLMFVQVSVAEGGAGPVEALSWSWALTEGRVLTVFGVALAGGVIVCAGVLACCVGFIPALGMFALLHGSLYVALRARVAPPSAPSSPAGAAAT